MLFWELMMSAANFLGWYTGVTSLARVEHHLLHERPYWNRTQGRDHIFVQASSGWLTSILDKNSIVLGVEGRPIKSLQMDGVFPSLDGAPARAILNYKRQLLKLPLVEVSESDRELLRKTTGAAASRSSTTVAAENSNELTRTAGEEVVEVVDVAPVENPALDSKRKKRQQTHCPLGECHQPNNARHMILPSVVDQAKATLLLANWPLEFSTEEYASAMSAVGPSSLSSALAPSSSFSAKRKKSVQRSVQVGQPPATITISHGVSEMPSAAFLRSWERNRTMLACFHGHMAHIGRHIDGDFVNNAYVGVNETVRRTLKLQLGHHGGTSIGGPVPFEQYVKRIGKCKYCLCPKGLTSYTSRLYESFFTGCLPVIMSDDLEAPFEGEKISWNRAASHFTEPHDLLARLTGHRLERPPSPSSLDAIGNRSVVPGDDDSQNQKQRERDQEQTSYRGIFSEEQMARRAVGKWNVEPLPPWQSVLKSGADSACWMDYVGVLGIPPTVCSPYRAVIDRLRLLKWNGQAARVE
ncbi:unnamed protein product [Amoebophrya sp. A120]|nr:unnamed protein product [Amoebophrya sp. A120]|eukprot:GSA120T00018048001.1